MAAVEVEPAWLAALVALAAAAVEPAAGVAAGDWALKSVSRLPLLAVASKRLASIASTPAWRPWALPACSRRTEATWLMAALNFSGSLLESSSSRESSVPVCETSVWVAGGRISTRTWTTCTDTVVA